MKPPTNIKLIFTINGYKNEQIKFTGRVGNYSAEDFMVSFADNAALFVNSFISIRVDVYDKKRLLYTFDIYFNDIKNGIGKVICFGLPCLYVFEATKKTSDRSISRSITEEDMEKKFYTSVCTAADDSFKIYDFYLILPKNLFDTFYVFK